MSAVRRRVSIIINNYNYGAFVARAVESALAQTHTMLEVIVVDDGSSDESRAILEPYADRTRLLFTPNGGQAAALNRGFAISSGDLVLFLDADDALDPEAIARAAAVWHPGISKVHFPLRVIDERGRPLGFNVPFGRLASGEVRGDIERSGGYVAPPTSGNLFARSMLERTMPVPESRWRRWPDIYLITSAPFHGSIASIDDPLGDYRVHGRNSWMTNRIDAPRLRGYLEADEVKEDLLRQLFADRGFSLMHSADHVQARLASLRLDPEHHPYPRDARARLAWQGVRTSLRQRSYHRRKRVLAACWFAAVGVMPASLVRPIVELGYGAAGRPAWLRRLLRA